MGAALKLASGILEGRSMRRDRDEEKRRVARAEQMQNLELLSRIGDDDRFQIGGALGAAQPVLKQAHQGAKDRTSLTPDEETKFQSWAATNGVTDVDHPDSHYDYRGYWKETGGAAHKAGDHYPDTYKQHGHPTFSRESKYSTGPSDGGSWQGETFTPGAAAAADTTPPARRPMEVAKIALGDQELPVTFDPAQGKRARKEAVNRSAHTRLQQMDPDVWGGEFDRDFDYAGAEREERRLKEVEDGLVKSGMPRDRARLLAHNNVDLEKRDQERASAQALAGERGEHAADRRSERADKDRERTEAEALGMATQWAMFGKHQKMEDGPLVIQITESLKNTHPKLSYGQRAGIAAKAVQQVGLTDALTGERDRANRKGAGGSGILGRLGIDADSVAAATGAEGGAGGKKSAGKETRQQLMDRLIREGKSDQEIALEIQRRGL